MLRKLGPARALDPCHRPEGSWALGTRMEAGELEARETGDEHARDHGKEREERRNACKNSCRFLANFVVFLTRYFYRVFKP